MAQISAPRTPATSTSGTPAVTVMVPLGVLSPRVLSTGFIIEFSGVMKKSVAHKVHLSAVQRVS